MSAMTEGRWVTAADTLGTEETEAILRGVAKASRGDSEVEFLAVPQALVTRASGQSRGVAIAYGIRVARMNVAAAQRRSVPTDPALLPDVVVEAPSVPATPYLEDVLPKVSPTARRVLGALPEHILSSDGGMARAASGGVKVNGQTIAEAMGITGELAPSKDRKGQLQRRALIVLACACWAEVSEAMGNLRPGESRAQRAYRARLWVKRGHSNRQSRLTGAVFAPEVRVTRRLSVSAPFTPSQDGEAVRSITYRPAAPVKRIRSQRVTDGVGEGILWGGGGAVGMPSREVPESTKARRTVNSAVLSTGGREGSDAPAEWLRPVASFAMRDTAPLMTAIGAADAADWAADYAAGRLGVCPTADDNGRCQCPRTRTRGTDCERVDFTVEITGGTRTESAWLHPLAECESPTDTGQCGCGSKAGRLVSVNGTLRHPARPRRNR